MLLGTACAYFKTVFFARLQKINFGTNEVHMRAAGMKTPAFCIEFRSKSNGTSPGVKKSKIRKKKIQGYSLFFLVNIEQP